MLAVIRIEGSIRCEREEAGFSRPISVSSVLLFSICKELTDIVCISGLGSSAFVDLNVLELMASPRWTQPRLLL